MTVRTMKRADVDLDACPECGQVNTAIWDSFDTGDNEINQRASCGDCGAEWVDTYPLALRTIEGPGGENTFIEIED